MVDSAAPLAVHVLTPPQSHSAVTSSALREGSIALVEKPLATSSAEARDLINLAAARNARLSVCHNYLSMQAVRKALRLVAGGELGEVLSADIYWRATSLGDQIDDPTGWAHGLPGGLFHEVAPHPVYLLEALLGKLTVVAAQVFENRNRKSELRAFVEGERGPGSLTVSLQSQPVSKWMRVHGERQSLHVDLATNVLVRLRDWGAGASGRAALSYDGAAQSVAGTTSNVARSLAGRMPRTHLEFLRSFYNALGRGESPPITGEDGLSTVQTLDQMWALCQPTA